MTVKTALVTGASSGHLFIYNKSPPNALSLGIGRATAIALLKAGWNVILTARRNDALQETVNLATESGATGKSFSITGDITDEAFVKRLFAEGVGHFGT